MFHRTTALKPKAIHANLLVRLTQYHDSSNLSISVTGESQRDLKRLNSASLGLLLRPCPVGRQDYHSLDHNLTGILY